MKTKRVIAPFEHLVQHPNLKYDRYSRSIRHKDSFALAYSKQWIERNQGLTEEEVRGNFNSMVDGYDITLIDELFIEVEANIVTFETLTKNHRDTIINVLDLTSFYDGNYDREMVLENFYKDRLIRIITNLADLIDDSRDILRIGLTKRSII